MGSGEMRVGEAGVYWFTAKQGVGENGMKVAKGGRGIRGPRERGVEKNVY